MYRFLDRESAWYLQRLMVDRRFQRRGAARAAVLALIDRLSSEGRSPRLLLSVVPENRVAIQLYLALGFVLTGRADEDGELEMVRTLSAPE